MQNKKSKNSFSLRLDQVGYCMNIMLSRIYLLFCLFLASSHLFASMEKFIESLEQIGTKGAGNEKAVANWNVLSTMSSSSIPRLLDSMNRANDLGDNWIRSAIQEILAKSGLPSLPKDEVVQFIRNTQNDGSSRRAAYEFLSESHPQIAQSQLHPLLTTPNRPFAEFLFFSKKRDK